ncbi:MAG: S8 family serine peptidase [Nitrospirae bacterium]|nr:S8 family serine peptidase [Nitrospirota bacterium]
MVSVMSNMRSRGLFKHVVSVLFLAVLCFSAIVPISVSAGELRSSPKSKIVSGGGYEKLASQADSKGSVRVIVKLDVSFRPMGSLSSVESDEQTRAISRAQEAVIGQLSQVNIISYYKYKYIPHIAMTVDRDALDTLISIAEVISVEEDKLSRPTQVNWNITKVGAPTAWSSGYDGTGYTVAILDTGVDKTHPILTGKVVSEACYSSYYPASYASSICAGAGTDLTSSGCAMPYVGNCPSGKCDHGTHVAGIAAGQNTGQSSGVAKGANIIAIQVFSRFDDNSTNGCSGKTPCVLSYDSDQIKGLERVYALKSTYSIASINMSIGGGKYTSNCDNENSSYKSAVDNLRSAGIATVISSGNDGYTNGIAFPGCISSAVSVGATDSSDVVASYSNSASFLSLLAPGSSILSSVPNGQYATWDGTSMAAPHVTGAWAVLKQSKPTASVTNILSALSSTGVSITDARDNITKSRIQVDAALSALTVTSYSLSVTKSGTGSGTVTASSGTLSWSGSTGTASYTSGTSVTLTAAATSGSSFSSWSGCDSTSGSQCTITMSAAKSVTVTFTSSIMPDSDAAAAAFNAIYSQYASWFGSTSGSIQTGTSWVAYYQLYTNGAYLVTGTDGNLYVYYNGQLSSLNITWKTFGYAATKITSIYNQYASWFGSASGGIGAGTSGSVTYYYQWYNNGAALVAWTDGYMYTYYNGTWYPFGVSWR